MNENLHNEFPLENSLAAADAVEARAESRSALVSGQLVLVGLRGAEPEAGRVDELTDDGSVVWVDFGGAFARRMFHVADPEEIHAIG